MARLALTLVSPDSRNNLIDVFWKAPFINDETIGVGWKHHTHPMSLSRAQHYFNQGQTPDAISELDLIIERHGSDETHIGKRPLAKARLLRSLCFRCVGRLEEALEDLETVITLDPTLEIISLQQMATLLSEAKLFGRSIVAFSRILTIDSGNLDALFGELK